MIEISLNNIKKSYGFKNILDGFNLEIKTGDKVDIKIQAYYEDTHQVISGVISDIGDVPLKTEDRGTVYKVEIMLNEDASNLKLGMEGTVDIITGKRNVMDYFLEPLIDGVKGSMREK